MTLTGIIHTMEATMDILGDILTMVDTTIITIPTTVEVHEMWFTGQEMEVCDMERQAFVTILRRGMGTPAACHRGLAVKVVTM